MNRYARALDGALPLAVILYDDEEVVASQDGVGLYDANQKALDHQLGTVHVTTHRLLYADAAHPHSRSLALALAYVTQTDHYAGFLKSSPKVTLFLSSADSTEAEELQAESWVCQVCSYRNPPALGDAARRCGLCGVPREDVTPTQTPEPASPYSGNISSSLSTPAIVIPHLTRTSARDPIACPACTFLNHPSLRNCEICGTPLEPQVASSVSRSFKSAPTSRPETPAVAGGPVSTSERDSIKISFRKGGDKPFYAALKRTLMGKAWETKGRKVTDATQASPFIKSGIHGIMQHVKQDNQAADQTLRSALQDLEALMAKAKDMVELTSSLNAKLTAQEEQRARVRTLHPELAAMSPAAVEEPEEAKFIRSSLSQMGLQTTAVTQDMVKDEKQWAEQLAKELGSVLVGARDSKGKEQDGLMRRRGIVGLDEIWGGWNRARGVALIPPETMMLCLPYLPGATNPPIRLRTFRSGLRVLHTPQFTEAAFTARLVALISLSGPRSTMEIAREEGINDALAAEMVEGVEELGEILRDEQGPGGEIRWWRNILRDYTWDGG